MSAKISNLFQQACFAVSILILILGLTACAQMKYLLGIEPGFRPGSTYEKFRKSAIAGDPESQNLLGFMLFFGESAPMNRPRAHRWFHAAAAQGNVSAQLNLAVMHHLGAGVLKDEEETERYFRLAKENNSQVTTSSLRLELPDSLEELLDHGGGKTEVSKSPGEVTFMTFCAGCHGLNGIAAYVDAPSFAIGERMEKSDAELLGTVMNGHGAMPIWSNKLNRQDMTEALRFVRSLQLQYQKGIGQVLRTRYSIYFLFGPMSYDDTAYHPEHLE